MSNVFTIIQEYDALMAEVEESGGELTPELAAKLAINEAELAKKVRAYYFVIKTKTSEIQLAKDEQERLNNVRQVKENLIKRLKKVVDLALETYGTPTPTGNKKLDLGDLKVWQKKTDALDVTGTIDDERFCQKQMSLLLNYKDADAIYKLLTDNDVYPTTTIVILKDKLKDWLLDNEKEYKELINEHNERVGSPNIEFEENKVKMSDLTPEKEKDIKILLNTDLKHNSTVIFK